MFQLSLFCRLLIFVAAVSLSQAAERPNIVLILADDLGVNDLSCYGRSEQPTPHLDRLATDGVRFTAATCALPICSPSRAALLTGKSPARLHLTNFLPGRADAPSQKLQQPVIEGQLPLEEVTLAELLREAGYATACVGKWHLGWNKNFGPEKQGFDYVYAGQANTKPSEAEGSKGEYDLTAKATAWMEQNKARPFFLYLPHNTPHIPFGATEGDKTKHAGKFNPTYAAVIGHMDECVGRVMSKVDELGLRERTIFIFASDNGGLHVLEFPGTPATHNTPFRAGKGYLYEGGLRVPLIVRWPGTLAPRVEQGSCSLADLTPTLLAAVGLDHMKVTGPLDGENLLSWWKGGAAPQRTLFWHYPHYVNQGARPAGAAREGKWKLIEHYEDGALELYDLSADPSETRNLAAEQPEQAKKMRDALAAWRVRMGAQEMTPNPVFSPEAAAPIYRDRDSSRLAAAPTAAELEVEWKPWRAAMNETVKGRPVRITPPTGDVRLLWDAAVVHGEKIRIEPQPQKRTVGYWVNPADWVEWKFTPPAPGRYEVEVLQGCGKGSGGSQIEVTVGDAKLEFAVVETGHFQHFIQRTIGAVELGAGEQTIAFRAKTKPGGAVMDLRRVVLRPLK